MVVFGQDISDSCYVGASGNTEPLEGSIYLLKLQVACFLLLDSKAALRNAVNRKSRAIWCYGRFDIRGMEVVDFKEGINEGFL